MSRNQEIDYTVTGMNSATRSTSTTLWYPYYRSLAPLNGLFWGLAYTTCIMHSQVQYILTVTFAHLNSAIYQLPDMNKVVINLSKLLQSAYGMCRLYTGSRYGAL